MIVKTTYVTVPVHFHEEADGSLRLSIDMGDDGTPGLWGDTYVYDHDEDEGEWSIDRDAQMVGSELVGSVLKRGEMVFFPELNS